MTLAHFNCTEVSSIDTQHKNTVLRFENRIKCLNSVFWNIHNAIENGERNLLVIDKKEDLEYINYFLSKYKLKPLSIIANAGQEYISQTSLARLNGHLKLQTSNEKQDDIKSAIDFLSDTILNHNQKLRLPKLGKLNILEIFERKKITALSHQRLNVDFYQLVPFTDFKAKKLLVVKAAELYKPEFRFKDKENILKDAFILNMSFNTIKSIFSDIQDELNSLFESINKIVNQIEKEITQIHVKQTKEMHRYFFEISKYKNKKELSETDLQKVNHLADKFDTKSKSKSSHLPLQERFTAIESLYLSHVNKLSAEKKKFSQYTLQRINKFNGGENAIEIFKKIDLISKKIGKTHAFKDFQALKPCSLLACNQICEDLISKIDHAEFFVETSQEYMNWLHFINGLNAEERTIIEALTKVKSNWVEVFESNYLDGFLSSEIINLFDIEPSFNDLNDKLEDYKNQVAIKIHNHYKTEASNKIIPNAEGSETKISWVNFFSEFGNNLTTKFPLLIMDSKSFDKHADILQTIVDKSIFLNSTPRLIPSKSWNKNIFAGYNSQFLSEIVGYTKKYEDVVVKNYRGIEYNVNRSINQLNNSEKNMMALFLGQSMHKLNPQYRIFQLKAKSIISFLKDDKNAQLMQSLIGLGCKEIFSQEENNNLLPGIIADPNCEPVLLVEDNLLLQDSQVFNFEQMELLKKVKDAGIKVLSINNYRLLTQKKYSLDMIIAKLLANQVLKNTEVKA